MQKYKFFISITFLFIGFLIIRNEVYCHPLVLTLVTPVISYFSSISPEFYAGKIIDKIFEYSPWIMSRSLEYSPYVIYGTGILGITAIGLPVGVKLSEFVYNWRYFANQYAHNTPVVGSLLKGATYKWFTNKELTNIEYTYFFPKIVKALGYPDLFNQKLEIDLNTFKSNLTSKEPHIENRDRTLFVDTPINVIEFKDKPVYGTNAVFKERENIVELTQEVIELKTVVQESNLIHTEVNVRREAVAEELRALHQYNDTKFLKSLNVSDKLFLKNICFQYNPRRPNKINFELNFGSLSLENIKPVKLRMKFLEWQTKFPILADLFNLYSERDLLNNSMCSLERPSCVYLTLKYKKEQKGFFSVSVVDAYNCSFSAETIDPVNAIDAGVDIMLRQNETRQRRIDELVARLENKISNENRLINVETRDKGTQTSIFDITESIYERINTFLEVQDKISFAIATREGKKLPFAKLNDTSIEGDKNGHQEVGKTEISTQTDQFANAITSGTELATTLVQNPAMFFSTILSLAVVHNFQDIELAAKMLAGYTHIPEFSNVLLIAHDLRIADIKLNYGFTHEEAKRAYEAIGAARDIMYQKSLPSDISSTLSDSSTSSHVSAGVQIPWKHIMYGGLIVAGIVGVGLMFYYSYETGS